MQSRALVDFGEPSLNRAMRVYGPVGDLSYRDGLFYPSKAPLLSYAAAPIYAALRHLAGNRIGTVPEIPLVFFSRLFLTVLPTLVTARLPQTLPLDVRRRCRRRRRRRLLRPRALSPSATRSSSSVTRRRQTSSSWRFYVAWRWTRSEAPRPFLLLAGFLAATAVTAEYTSAMVAGLLGLWVPFARPQDRTLANRDARALRARGGGPSGAPRRVPLALLRFSARDGLQASRRRRVPALAPRWIPRNPDAGPYAPCALSLFSPLRGLFALSPGLLLGVAGSSAALACTPRMRASSADCAALHRWRCSWATSTSRRASATNPGDGRPDRVT